MAAAAARWFRSTSWMSLITPSGSWTWITMESSPTLESSRSGTKTLEPFQSGTNILETPHPESNYRMWLGSSVSRDRTKHLPPECQTLTNTVFWGLNRSYLGFLGRFWGSLHLSHPKNPFPQADNFPGRHDIHDKRFFTKLCIFVYPWMFSNIVLK